MNGLVGSTRERLERCDERRMVGRRADRSTEQDRSRSERSKTIFQSRINPDAAISWQKSRERRKRCGGDVVDVDLDDFLGGGGGGGEGGGGRR